MFLAVNIDDPDLRAYYKMDQDNFDANVYDLVNGFHGINIDLTSPNPPYFVNSRAILAEKLDQFDGLFGLRVLWNNADTVIRNSGSLHIADFSFLQGNNGNNIFFAHDAASNAPDLDQVPLVKDASDTSWFVDITDSITDPNAYIWMYWTGLDLDETKTYYLLHREKLEDQYAYAPVRGRVISDDTLSFAVSTATMQDGYYKWGSTDTDFTPGNAISFEFDTDDGILTLDTVLEGNTQFTFEAWINLRDTANQYAIFTQPSQIGDAVFAVYTSDPSQGGKDELAFLLEDNVGGGSVAYTDNDLLIPGRWHHIAAVFNGGGATDADRLTVYFDGVDQNLTFFGDGIPAVLGAASNVASIGADPVFLETGSNLAIDELRIWESVRTEAQILGNQFEPVDPSISDLILYYQFDQENPYAYVPDLSGNNIGAQLNTNFKFVDSSGWLPSGALQTPGALALVLGDSTIGEETVYIGATLFGEQSDTVDFYVINVGDDTLQFQSTSFIGGDVTEFSLIPALTPFDIPGGDTAVFSIVHNPSTFTGLQNVIVSVQTNDPTDSDLQFQLQAYAYSELDPPGSSISFDGVNGIVRTDSLYEIDFDAGEPYSIELWVRPESTPAGPTDIYGILSLGDESGDYLYINYDTTTQSVFYGIGGTTAAFSIPMPFGQWNHLAIVHDGVNSVAYKNGDFINSSTSLASEAIGKGILQLGEDFFGSVRPYNGGVDELRIWGKALSEQEIIDNFQGTYSGKEDSLLLYYRFDQSTGTLGYDLAGASLANLQGGSTFQPSTAAIINPSNFGSLNEVALVWSGDTVRHSGNLAIIGNGFFADPGDQITFGYDNVGSTNVMTENEGLTSTFVVENRLDRIWEYEKQDVSPTFGGEAYLAFSNIQDLDSTHTYYLILRDDPLNDFDVNPYLGYEIFQEEDSIVFQVDVDDLPLFGEFTIGRGFNGPLTALSFANAASVVAIDDPEEFSTMLTEFTVEAWVKLEGPLTGNETILGQLGANNNVSSFVVLMNGNGVPRLNVYNGSSFAARAWGTGDSLVVGEWAHLAVTYKDGDAITYFNGELSSNSLLAVTSINDPTTLFTIGNRENGTDPFPGDIDEVRIWNYERSQEQIAENVYRTIGSQDTGLVAYYRFDQYGSTDFLPDLSGNGIGGDLLNFSFTGDDGWVNSNSLRCLGN